MMKIKLSNKEESDQPDDVGGDELEEIESYSKKEKLVKYKIQEVIKKNQVISLQISKDKSTKGRCNNIYLYQEDIVFLDKYTQR